MLFVSTDLANSKIDSNTEISENRLGQLPPTLLIHQFIQYPYSFRRMPLSSELRVYPTVHQLLSFSNIAQDKMAINLPKRKKIKQQSWNNFRQVRQHEYHRNIKTIVMGLPNRLYSCNKTNPCLQKFFPAIESISTTFSLKITFISPMGCLAI